MRKIHFDTALLPDGWIDSVTVTVDDEGFIQGIEPATSAADATRIPGVAIPGLPNLHSHAHQRAMAGLAERSGTGDDDFWTWRREMYRCLERMTPEDLEAVAARLYLEMLAAGYTTVGEFQYLHHQPDGTPYPTQTEMSDRTIAAARRVGIGLTSLPVLYEYGDFGGQPAGDGQRRFRNDAGRFLTLVQDLHRECADDPQLALGIAPHSLRAVTGELLTEVLEGIAAIDGAMPVHIHVAEQVREVEACVAWSGRRPVEWLLEHFDVGPGWCLIHATHMTDEETDRLAATGAVAGLCPTTEANLGDGVFSARRYLAAGGRFGIGSDSHISVSPVEELRWLEYGQRLTHRGRTLLAGGPDCSTGRRLFETALAGGAQACGRPVAGLKTGQRADIVVLDDAAPILHGREGDALLDSWIFSGNVNVVRHVLVGGAQVIENGHHAAEEEIDRAYRDAVNRLSR